MFFRFVESTYCQIYIKNIKKSVKKNESVRYIYIIFHFVINFEIISGSISGVEAIKSIPKDFKVFAFRKYRVEKC